MTTVMMMWAGVAVLAAVALVFSALWLADARRANRVAADPERTHPPRPWLRARRDRASHRGRRRA